MEQQELNIQDLLLLKSQIEEGAKRRDLGIDPPIAQFDVPRERPALTNPNSPRDDYFASVFGPLGGEVSRDLDSAVSSVPDLAYALSGLELAADGGKNISEGMEAGSPMRVAGGAAEVGLAALPFGGKALQAAYKTIPRAMGTGAAYGASPLVAAGVFSPEDAQAAGIGDFIGDEVKKNVPGIALAALMGAIPGVGYKTMAKRGALEAQQEVADLGQVIANREMAEAAKRAKPDVGFHSMVDADVRGLEPPIYHNQGSDYLENFTMGKSAQKADDIQYVDRDGAIVGGAAALTADKIMNLGNEDHSFGQSITAGALGAGVSRAIPSLTRGHSKPVLQSRVEQYNPQDTLNKTRPLVQPIAKSHPIEIRETILRKLDEGETVNTLSRDYGVSETAIRRWKKMASSKTTDKPKQVD